MEIGVIDMAILRFIRIGLRRMTLALSLAVLVAATARAADVLNHVPDTALAVIVVNNAEKGSEKIDEVAKTLQLPSPGVLNLITGEANLDKGLNRQGAVAAVMFAPPEGQSNPRGVVLIPTTDYKALIGQLEPGEADGKKTPVVLDDKEMVAANVGGYAALAEVKDAKALDELLAGGTSIGSKLGDMSKWLDAQDAYALATTGGIALASDKLVEAMDKAEEQFEDLGDENQAATIKMVFGVYREMFKAAKTELSFAAAGVRAEDKGVHFTGRVTFKPGSDAAKYAATVKPPKEDLLKGLPDGKFVAAGGVEFSGDLLSEMYAWSAKMMQAAPGGKDLKKEDVDKLMQAWVDSTKGLKSMSFAMYAPEKDAPLYSSIVGLMRCDDSAKFLGDYKKSIEAMNDLAKKIKSPFLTEGTVEEMEIDGKKALELTLAIPQTAGADNPLAGEMFKKMFGDTEKIKAYVVAIDANTAAIGYITPDAIKQLMKDAGKKGIATNTNLAKAAELLPEGCQVQSYLSIKGMIDLILQIPGVEFSPVPALLGEFPETPPLGFGAKITSSGLETDLIVTEETLEAIGAAIARGRAVSAGPGAFVHDSYIRVAPASR
jgi:hypothetical protein